VQGRTGYVLAQQVPGGSAVGQSMTGYDPYKGGQDMTGIRVAQTGAKARQAHGTPVSDVAYIQTATGVRIAPTGEQAREAGVPIGSNV